MIVPSCHEASDVLSRVAVSYLLHVADWLRAGGRVSSCSPSKSKEPARPRLFKKVPPSQAQRRLRHPSVDFVDTHFSEPIRVKLGGGRDRVRPTFSEKGARRLMATKFQGLTQKIMLLMITNDVCLSQHVMDSVLLGGLRLHLREPGAVEPAPEAARPYGGNGEGDGGHET